MVNFGAVATNGGFQPACTGDAIELAPLPLSSAFTVRIGWQRLPWKLAEPNGAEAVGEDGSVLRSVAIRKSGEEIEFVCEPDVFLYRLRGA